MYLYSKQEGQGVPILLSWLPYPILNGYQEQKGSNFDVESRRFICCDLCDIQHVKFSREMTSLGLKPFGLQFA